jgi:hypothetical protein
MPFFRVCRYATFWTHPNQYHYIYIYIYIYICFYLFLSLFFHDSWFVLTLKLSHSIGEKTVWRIQPRIGPAHLMTALDTNGISISFLDEFSRIYRSVSFWGPGSSPAHGHTISSADLVALEGG